MRINSALDMQGRLTIVVKSQDGGVLKSISANNSIVLSGRDLVAKQFINESIDPISHIAVGTGNTPVDATNNKQLESELFRKEINTIDPTTHLVTTPEDRKKVTINTELDFDEGNGPLTEAGLFNSNSGGVMYNRVVFPPVNKTSDFKLTLLWEIIF